MPTGEARARELARLKDELRMRQQQLVEETARNERAKVHFDLLNSLVLASEAMGQLVLLEAASKRRSDSGGGGESSGGGGGDGGGGEMTAQQQWERQEERTRGALQAFERQLAALVHSLDRGHGGSSGGGGGPSASGSGAGAAGGGGRGRASSGDCGPAASSQDSGSAPAAYGGRAAASPAASGAGLQSDSSNRGSGGGGGGGGSDGAPGLLGLTASGFLREIAAGRSLVGTKPEFIAYWRQRVMGLALLAHQYRSGAATRGTVGKVIYEMGVRFGALFMFGNYVLEVIVLDMETGIVCEAPQSLWDRVAASLALTPDQALAFAILHRWWKATTQTYQRERGELTRAALEAPTDLALQEGVVEGLERVNRAYLSAAVAVLAVTMFGVTRPEQVAASWISCWPRMPLMTAIFDALERQRSL